MQLHESVLSLPMVGNRYKSKLEKLGISTIEDLLYHIPSRYINYSKELVPFKANPGDVGTVKGEVLSIKNIYTRNGKKFEIAEVSTTGGNFQIVWFNQPFIVRSINAGEQYSFSGKVEFFSNKLSLISPEYEKISSDHKTIHTGKLVAVYPETHGVSSKWLRSRINFALESSPEILKDFLEKEELNRLNFIDLKRAFANVHDPRNIKDVDQAKARLAFNELLFHQLKGLVRKSEWTKIKSSLKLEISDKIYQDYLALLPFKPTQSQQTAIKEVFNDLKKDVPMNRLLEGDVGSGKTVVAAAACYACFVNGYQSVVMAPTQILASQHFDTLNNIFEKLKIRISLVTGAGVRSDLGKSDIFIGTHALIHKKVAFDKVAVVIIDEQHRFGVEQRAHLIKKSTKGKKVPNVLTMTATPIPRSVALTLYGELDLSVLTELPKGRIPITTWIVPPQKRQGAYDWIKGLLKKLKVQGFVICPLIEESETESMKQVKAATVEFEELKKEFKGFKLEILHGKLKAGEKDRVLESFRSGKTDLLVSTPVVEVGIDVPNATIMVIEGGERYGLAQLHQLRGRIGRGDKKSYCLIFTSLQSQRSSERLVALTKNLSGFELSELDLKLRGPGELMGTRQHGFPELKIASWGDTELIKKSRDFAEEMILNKQKYRKIFDDIEAARDMVN